jgi:hypothetical protein
VVTTDGVTVSVVVSANVGIAVAVAVSINVGLRVTIDETEVDFVTYFGRRYCPGPRL